MNNIKNILLVAIPLGLIVYFMTRKEPERSFEDHFSGQAPPLPPPGCPPGEALMPTHRYVGSPQVCTPIPSAPPTMTPAMAGHGKGIKGIHYDCAPGYSLQNTSRQIGASRECRANPPGFDEQMAWLTNRAPPAA